MEKVGGLVSRGLRGVSLLFQLSAHVDLSSELMAAKRLNESSAFRKVGSMFQSKNCSILRIGTDRAFVPEGHCLPMRVSSNIFKDIDTYGRTPVTTWKRGQS